MPEECLWITFFTRRSSMQAGPAHVGVTVVDLVVDTAVRSPFPRTNSLAELSMLWTLTRQWLPENKAATLPNVRVLTRFVADGSGLSDASVNYVMPFILHLRILISC
jgi:hypothetical protein